MMQLQLTAETLLKAKTYLTLAEKQRIAETAGRKCLYRVQTGGQDGNGNAFPLPPMVMENAQAKARLLLGTLLIGYLRLAYDTEDGEYLLTEEEYDEAAACHAVNQIERLKRDKAVQDICFDLLADYKALEKMVNAEIYGTVQVRNDGLVRVLDYFKASITPEAVKSLLGELDGLQAQAEALQGRKEP